MSDIVELDVDVDVDLDFEKLVNLRKSINRLNLSVDQLKGLRELVNDKIKRKYGSYIDYNSKSILDLEMNESLKLTVENRGEFFHPNEISTSKEWLVMRVPGGWSYSELDKGGDFIHGSNYFIAESNDDETEENKYGVWNRTNPPGEGKYLVMMFNGYCKTAIWQGHKWMDLFNSKRMGGNVIGWMHIPTGVRKTKKKSNTDSTNDILTQSRILRNSRK